MTSKAKAQHPISSNKHSVKLTYHTLTSPTQDSESPTGHFGQAYHNLRSAHNKVAQRYDKDRNAHQSKVGDTAMYTN